MNIRNLLVIGLLFFTGCHSTVTNGPAFPDQPSRAAYEGFEWEIVSGAGLQFWAQRNASIHMETDPTIPGAKIVWDDRAQPASRTVIQIFSLPNEQIDDVLATLHDMPTWSDTITCEFQKHETSREGVTRYTLVPSGEYARQLQILGTTEPIPTTCGGWGVGNSGIRYFEIHDNQPDKAIFMEIGQDAPLYDEQSIVLTN